MIIENSIFNKYDPDLKKLIEYGFIKNNLGFYYEKKFKNNEFKAIVIIKEDGEILGKVIENETNEEYLPLNIKSQEGAYIGGIKEEYKQILTDIRDNCFLKKYFISNQANRITDAIISKYNDYPCFMWEKSPDCGVFKNSANNKWYGIIMNINYLKLGKNINKSVEVVNLKLDKDEIRILLKQDGFYPAWHMNKKYWISITLDDVLPDEQILNLIEKSYSYTVKKR